MADQGPGIPEADRARATERFFRGEAARSTPGRRAWASRWCRRWRSCTAAALRLEDAGPGLRARLMLPTSESLPEG